MGKYRAENEEVVVGEVTSNSLSPTPSNVQLGTFTALAPLRANVTVGGKQALRGPLSFMMAGCVPIPGTTCMGGGVILPKQTSSRGQVLPLLTVGSQGTCIGVCTLPAPPFAQPQVCQLKIKESGQADGLKEQSAKQGVGDDSVVSSSEAGQELLDKASGTMIVFMGPRFQSLYGLLQFKNPKSGDWEDIADSSSIGDETPATTYSGTAIYIPKEKLELFGGVLKVRIKPPPGSE